MPVYRADTIDITPTRPEHVLLVVEVVPPARTTDQYARAGIAFYWRVEQAVTGTPLVHKYVLDPATARYRDSDLSTPFALDVDLGRI